MLPSTWVQVIVVVAVVAPGFTYQLERRRVTGPDPDEADVSIRILRAIMSSAILASLYAVVLGPVVLRNLPDPFELSASNLRNLGLTVFVLVFLVPWLAARAAFYLGTSSWWQRCRDVLSAWSTRILGTRKGWDPTPSAWDFAFSRAEPAFVRILTSEGLWIGGYWGAGSYASSFPDPRNIYLEIGYEMGGDGTFTGIVSAAEGVYVRCEDVVLVDFSPVVDEPGPPEGTEADDTEAVTSDTGGDVPRPEGASP